VTALYLIRALYVNLNAYRTFIFDLNERHFGLCSKTLVLFSWTNGYHLSLIAYNQFHTPQWVILLEKNRPENASDDSMDVDHQPHRETVGNGMHRLREAQREDVFGRE